MASENDLDGIDLDADVPNISHKGKTIRSYTASFKLKVIVHAKRVSISSAARQFNVDRRMAARGVKNRDQIKAQTTEKHGTEKKRLSGGGRKPLSEELESLTLEWVLNRRLKGLRVSRKLIRKKALLLFKEMGDESDFVGSKGWCEKFMKRNGLSLRRKTTVCQKDPEMVIAKLVAYVLRIRRLRLQHNYTMNNIYAMDETPIWCDMISTSTVEKTGSKSVHLKSMDMKKAVYQFV